LSHLGLGTPVPKPHAGMFTTRPRWLPAFCPPESDPSLSALKKATP